MEIRGFCRRLVLALPFVCLTLPLPAATPELDPLAGEVSSFVAAGAPDGRTSLKLALRLGASERTAGGEADAVRRAALLERLADLRRELVAASPRGAAAVPDKGVTNATITGRVTDDGQPVAGVSITSFDQNGYSYDWAYTGSDGRYSLILPPGTYVLYANPPYGSELATQLYDGLSCTLTSGCEPSDGTPLVMLPGGHRTADFALADLGRIEGRVRRRDNQAPVATGVAAYTIGDFFVVASDFSEDGAYSLGGLPPGEYWVIAGRSGELAGMIYDGIPCAETSYGNAPVCPPAGATRVSVTIDQVVTGIDFDLYVGGSLTGRLTDARDGSVVYGTAELFDAMGRRVASTYTDSGTGSFLIEGLPGGIYYLGANGYDFTPQFFEGKNCAALQHCPATGATPIEVELGAQTGPIVFRLDGLGSLSGRVLDERSGAAVENAYLNLLDRASGASLRSVTTDSAGFFSLSNLPAVQYALQISHSSYVTEYFDDVDGRLAPSAGTPIPVLPGELTSVEVRLAPRGFLELQAVAAENGEPLECVSMVAYPVNGIDGSWAYQCGTDGRVRLENLTPGDYHVVVAAGGYADYLYGQGSCTRLLASDRCDLSRGTPVTVRGGEVSSLGLAVLERSVGLRASVVFAAGSPPSARARLRLYDAAGYEVRSPVVTFYSPGFAFYDLAPGTYHLVADGSPDWQSFAYPDRPCGRWYCDPSLGSELRLLPNASVDLPPIALAPIAPYAGCTPGETALCLNQGRYRVSAAWRDFAGASGAGTARGLTADSGYFYFFSPSNLEVLIKVLNACDPLLGHHFWVYGAGLTNVQVELRVEDTLTGAVELYSNALGSTFQPILDSAAFATCDANLPSLAAEEIAWPAAAPVLEESEALFPPAAGGIAEGVAYCQPDAQPLCLGGRFEVEARYRTAVGNEGSGVGARVTPDTATFYFFDAANVELVVKILEACSSELPGYWVFASGLTDVEVELTITDRATGASKIYRNELGPFAPILDLRSFPCD